MVEVVKFSSFFQFPFRCLKFVGLNPTQNQNDKSFKTKLTNFHFKFFLASLLTMESLSILSIVHDPQNLRVVALMILQGIFFIFVFFKVFLISSKKEIFQEVLELCESHFLKSLEDQEKLKLQRRLKNFKRIGWTSTFPGVAGQELFLLSFIVSVIITQSWVQKFSVEVWFPFDEYDPKFYTFTVIWFYWFYLSIFVSISGADLTLYALVTLISIHADGICIQLKNIIKVPESQRDKEMKTLLQSHVDLIICTEKLHDIFSTSLFLQFFGSSAILCLAGYQSINSEDYENTVKYAMIFVSIFGQVFLACFYGSKIIVASEKINKAVYDSEWNEMKNKKVKHAMMFMILRTQKPCVLRAGKFATVSLKVFLSVSYMSS